jgi:GAF domain-containing protein
LAEALQREAATAEVLKAISRSTFDLQTVLNTLVESAGRLCEADAAGINRYDGSAVMPSLAFWGFSPEYIAYVRDHPIPMGRGSTSGRAILERRTVHIHDVMADAEFGFVKQASILDRDFFKEESKYKFAGRRRALALGRRPRTSLAVPLMREGDPIGVIILLRRAVRPFTKQQIELVETFADQAMIAIENARLFDEVQVRTKELTEALEQQTATSEVLSVISSSPGELEAVFNKMLENATRVCDAKFGTMVLHEEGTFRHVALHNVPPEFIELVGRDAFLRPSPGGPLDRASRTKKPVHVPDLRDEPTYLAPGVTGVREIADIGGARSFLVMPMLKEGELIGVIGIYRQEVRPFTDKQIELVHNFAAQAVIAIENTRLLKELRQRTADLTESLEQQTATSEVLGVISSSPGELEPVFNKILQNATRICNAEFGAMLLEEQGAFRTVALYNIPPAYAELLGHDPVIYPPPDSGLQRVARTKQPVAIADYRDEPAYLGGIESATNLVDVGGARSVLGVPMLKEGELIGVITIYRQIVRPFSERQIELVTNFAAQAVIAIENTRLLNELRESLDRQTATSEVLQVIRTYLKIA